MFYSTVKNSFPLKCADTPFWSAMAMHKILCCLLIYFCCFLPHLNGEDMFLRNNLKLARTGDFIVTTQNKTYTVLLINHITDQEIAIEEITTPTNCINLSGFSWKNWIAEKGPGHTAWVRYVVDTTSGQMKEYFSFTKNSWYTVPEGENFLSTLLNLKLHKVSIAERKKVGPPPPRKAPDNRPYWQPKMIFEGKVIPGVMFDAWRTFWPKDSSELSGKIIEVYVPQNPGTYPAYFPYWLQVSGIVGKAKVHIIDSGRGARGRSLPLQNN